MGYTVLNYNNYISTFDCVNSIIDKSGSDDLIVIVDNNSNNESLRELNYKFSDHPRVRIIASNVNGGYSAGNNLGIKYLRSAGVKHIVIATSDTTLLTNNFSIVLENIINSRNTSLAVIAPIVITPNNINQNPVLEAISLNYIINIFAYKIIRKIASYRVVAYFLIRRRNLINLSKEELANVKSKKKCLDVYMVHGSFLCLTDGYFSYFDGLDDSLFMYGEEDILSYRCAKRRLDICFTPSLSILHQAEGSVSTQCSNSFRKDNLIISNKVLRKKISMLFLLRQCLLMLFK